MSTSRVFLFIGLTVLSALVLVVEMLSPGASGRSIGSALARQQDGKEVTRPNRRPRTNPTDPVEKEPAEQVSPPAVKPPKSQQGPEPSTPPMAGSTARGPVASYAGAKKGAIVAYRTSDWLWYVQTKDGVVYTKQWGTQGDIPILNADFDGDGVADIAVWRPSDQMWYVRTSTSNWEGSRNVQLGPEDGIPLAQMDLDGDGLADPVVWRRADGVWSALLSSTQYQQRLAGKLGTLTYRPLIGFDIDGDHKSDIVLWDEAKKTMVAQLSGENYATTHSWPLGGEAPMPADLDGDGRTDIVYSGRYALAKNDFQSPVELPEQKLSGPAKRRADADDVDSEDVCNRPRSGPRPAFCDFELKQETRGKGSGSATNIEMFDMVDVSGDYDGDGRPDPVRLTVVQDHKTKPELTIWFSSKGFSATTFRLNPPYVTAQRSWWNVGADFDGDGKADVSYWDQSLNRVFVFGSKSNWALAQTPRLRIELPAGPGVWNTINPQTAHFSALYMRPLIKGTSGFADIHLHQMDNLAFGGNIIHGNAFGPIDEALPSCRDKHGKDGDDLPNPGNSFPGCALFEKTRNTNIGEPQPFGRQDVFSQIMGSAQQKDLVRHEHGNRFDSWPRWYNNASHQSAYEDWLYRAVQGGLRLIVMQAENSRPLCELPCMYKKSCGSEGFCPAPGRSCDDMENLEKQILAAKEMEIYLNAKPENHGDGWYKVVDSPERAAEVIRQNKLAVVLGIESSEIFYCKGELETNDAACIEDIKRRIDKLYALGVRYVFPVHHGDNALGGTAFNYAIQQSDLDPNLLSNPVGWLMSAAGRLLHIAHYRIKGERCDVARNAPGFLSVLLEPEYRGVCNARGLTYVGKDVLLYMFRRGMMIDTDHMSRRTASGAFKLAMEGGFPIFAGHVNFRELVNIDAHPDADNEGSLNPDTLFLINKLGGMVGVMPNSGGSAMKTYDRRKHGRPTIPYDCRNSSNTTVQSYLYAFDNAPGMSLAFGTDFGAATGVGPRFGKHACPPTAGEFLGNPQRPNAESRASRASYPFTAVVTQNLVQMQKSQIGGKEFDINVDGVGHIGMLPDLIEDMRVQGLTDQELEPLVYSAEGFIASWRHAEARKSAP